MLSGKKGQVSIEVLAILGVVVIGSIVFGAYYISSINKNISDSSKVASVLDGFEDQLGDGTGHPNVPNIPSVICNRNGNCETSLGEDNGNCPDDCSCGDGLCLPPSENYGSCPIDCPDTIPDFATLQLTLDPTGNSAIDASFGIKVKVANSSYDLGNVGKLDISDSTGSPTSNCSYNGVYNNTFTNLGRLNQTIPAGSIENTFDFTCKTPGTYTFSFSGVTPNELTTPTLSGAITKIITSGLIPPPPTPVFNISITSPIEGQAYFNNQSIQLTATELDFGTTGISCEWHIGDRFVSVDKSCNYSFDLATLTLPEIIGEQKVIVYATKVIDGISIQSKDEKMINIYKSDPTVAYLTINPPTQYVGEEFNIKIASMTQNLLTNPTITFTDSINCNIDLTRAISGYDIVNGTNVYYKLLPTTCPKAMYQSQDNLKPVNAIFNGKYTLFYVGYDLLFKSGNCNSFASGYGVLQACALPMGGLGYNTDYWQNNGYGLLKVYADQSSGTTTNPYGTLTVYVTE
ncbi:MAG: hypothetical protein WCX82_04280 [archaeon]|jgi:hypothetical protein